MRIIKLSFLAVLLILVTRIKAGAQTLSFADAGIVSYGTGVSTDFEVDVTDTLVNGFPSTKNVIWSIVKISGPTEWTFTNCDAASCYSAVSPYNYLTNANSTTPLNMNPAGTSINLFHVIIHGKDGAGSYMLNCFVAGDSANTVKSRLININVAYVNGISKAIPSLEVKLFPIPTADILNVELGANSSVKRLEIYNLIGSKVSPATSVISGRNEIAVGTLNPGMYFLKLIDNRNNVLMTKTFQKK